MKLYIFRCRTRPRMYGATRFETASNLPTDRCSGGWEFYERVILGIRTTVPFDVDTNILRREVQKYGWYVWDETPAAARREPPVESKPMTRERMLPAVEPKVAATEVQPLRITKTIPPTTTEVMPPPRAVGVTAPRKVEAPRRVAPSVHHHAVWFDIPVRNLDRAIRFYSAVLGTTLKKEQAGFGSAISVLPHADGSIGGCLVSNVDSKPSDSGPLLYLNADGRLEEALDLVEEHGGKVLTTRHSIAPFGFRAIILDSEGNRIALHSS